MQKGGDIRVTVWRAICSATECTGCTDLLSMPSSIRPSWCSQRREILEALKEHPGDTFFCIHHVVAWKNKSTIRHDRQGGLSPPLQHADQLLFLQAAIRKELNEFKSTEMEVHELSRHLTRLVPTVSRLLRPSATRRCLFFHFLTLLYFCLGHS